MLQSGFEGRAADTPQSPQPPFNLNTLTLQPLPMISGSAASGVHSAHRRSVSEHSLGSTSGSIHVPTDFVSRLVQDNTAMSSYIMTQARLLDATRERHSGVKSQLQETTEAPAPACNSSAEEIRTADSRHHAVRTQPQEAVKGQPSAGSGNNAPCIRTARVLFRSGTPNTNYPSPFSSHSPAIASASSNAPSDAVRSCISDKKALHTGEALLSPGCGSSAKVQFKVVSGQTATSAAAPSSHNMCAQAAVPVSKESAPNPQVTTGLDASLLTKVPSVSILHIPAQASSARADVAPAPATQLPHAPAVDAVAALAAASAAMQRYSLKLAKVEAAMPAATMAVQQASRTSSMAVPSSSSSAPSLTTSRTAQQLPLSLDPTAAKSGPLGHGESQPLLSPASWRSVGLKQPLAPCGGRSSGRLTAHISSDRPEGGATHAFSLASEDFERDSPRSERRAASGAGPLEAAGAWEEGASLGGRTSSKPSGGGTSSSSSYHSYLEGRPYPLSVTSKLRPEVPESPLDDEPWAASGLTMDGRSLQSTHIKEREAGSSFARNNISDFNHLSLEGDARQVHPELVPPPAGPRHSHITSRAVTAGVSPPSSGSAYAPASTLFSAMRHPRCFSRAASGAPGSPCTEAAARSMQVPPTSASASHPQLQRFTSPMRHVLAAESPARASAALNPLFDSSPVPSKLQPLAPESPSAMGSEDDVPPLSCRLRSLRDDWQQGQLTILDLLAQVSARRRAVRRGNDRSRSAVKNLAVANIDFIF